MKKGIFFCGSMEYINKEALRILKLFVNDDITSVKATVGAERKYFLVPKEIYYKRKDLIYTGRTLFSDKAPKGQELDHYFGTIKPRVAAYTVHGIRILYNICNEINSD